MLGKTNATVSTGGSGGGATVQAVNKTGSTISTGQKVWLNDGGQVQGSSYQMYGSSGTSTYYQLHNNVIDPSGQYGSRGSRVYSLTGTEATQISTSFSGSYGAFNYYFYDGENEALLLSNVFSPADTQPSYYNLNNNNIYGLASVVVIPGYKSNYCMPNSSTIQTFDYTTGTLSDAYTLTMANTNYRRGVLVYLDIYKTIYNIYSDNKYWEITNEGLVEGTWTPPGGFYPIGCTQDSQYIICKDSSQASANYNLRLLKVNSQFDIVALTQTEMPADLQDYYEADCSITFNTKTQILTCTKTGSSDYVVMQYSGGSWTKLNIDLSTELASYPYWRGGLFLSDDLSRASLNVGTVSNGAYYGRIVNLTAQTGYIAQNYATYNVNSDTITGYAAENAATDASFEANVAGAVS